MGIILLEATHTGQAVERTRELVAVQHAEICKAQRQLAPTAATRLEHNAVAGAVHGLEGILVTLGGIALADTLERKESEVLNTVNNANSVMVTATLPSQRVAIHK